MLMRMKAVGRILCDQLDAIFVHWKQFKTGALSRSTLQQQLQEVIENIRITLIIGSAGDKISSKTAALCHDLLDRFDTLWTFLSEENVEPANNLAERNLRPAVIYRKLTGGSQSQWGMKFVERLLTILLNIAEGAGEYASSEKIRFYRMAKRSATECAAIFDLCRELQLIEEKCYVEVRELLARIVAMLIRMAQGPRQIQSGPHTLTLTN